MKFSSFIFLLVFIITCNVKQEQHVAVSHQQVITPAPPLNYDSCKRDVQLTRQKNRPYWNKLSKQQKEGIFIKAVAETILPNWIGTSWDFNGTSETPGKGSIACGYFVTTVLRDAGLNLARVRLAQCASEQMILSLIQPRYVQRFSNVAMSDFMSAIREDGYGLYIVGLDNHTGFIYNDGTDTWFIHSTFVGTRNVQKEKAARSWVLAQSKYKVLGKISADEKALDKWAISN